MALENYVKFLRGTPSQYENLAVKDKDTLYFISEKDGEYGKLYLGTKLIAGAGQPETITFDSLKDITLNEGVIDGSLLVYDSEKEVWIDKPLDEILEEVILDISTVAIPQVFITSLCENETHEAAIARMVGDKKLQTGDIAIVKELIEENKYRHIAYVYKDGWVFMSESSDIESSIEDLQNVTDKILEEIGKPASDLNDASGLYAELDKKADINNVYTKEETIAEINSAVSKINNLERKIVTSYSDILIFINENGVEEAAKYIFMVPETDIAEGNLYEEYIVVNGTPELIGKLTPGTGSYITSVSNDFVVNQGKLSLNTDAGSLFAQLNDELNNQKDSLDDLIEKVAENATLIQGLNTTVEEVVLKYNSVEEAIETLNSIVTETKTATVTNRSLINTLNEELKNFVTVDDYNADIEDIRKHLTWSSIED